MLRMKESPQKRALKNYRDRLEQRGMARFEVLGLDKDRELIRSVARRLAEDGKAAKQLREAVSHSIAGEPQSKGKIYAALRRSPLVGVELKIAPRSTRRRKVDL